MADKKYDKKLYHEIKQDLLDQLERNGGIGRQYEDLIQDYMNFWVAKQMLNEDILDRGVTCKYNNGGGQTGYKRNDSVADMVKVNTQMLKILAELNLKPPKPSEKTDVDDEDYM